MPRRRRLLTLGHSYVVAENRRLADALASEGAGEWEVTVAAPERFPGDLAPLTLTPREDEPCRLVPLPVRRAERIHVMTYGPELRALLAEGWDVVHCWEEPYILAAGQVARHAPRNAALVYATFQNLPKRYPPPFSLIERYALRRADGWIAWGRTVEEVLRDRAGYRDRPHRVITPGVDVARFRPDGEARRRVRASLGWAEAGPPVIGYLGRFVEAKGLRVLTAALGRVANPHRALLVGGGELEAELRAWAAAAGDERRIVTGVPHARAADYLNAMDVLVLPSLTTPRWREQFGRVLIEAMACGVAVVASDSGEMPHVLGGAGVVAPEGDSAALAAVLDELVANDARRDAVAGAGLERARTEFALPVIARRHLELFASLPPRGSGR